jgi:hypothetical protein
MLLMSLQYSKLSVEFDNPQTVRLRLLNHRDIRLRTSFKEIVMMIKSITAAVALVSFVSLPAAAEPKKMSSEALDQIVAGTDYCPPPTLLKGNNGWGNGADPSNPGSDNGLTAPSKLANFNLPPGQDRPNTNPTGSTGR